jgi:hypothetical protein
MQKKDNPPCNNQLKKTKERKTKEGNIPPKQMSPEKCLQNNQEATVSPPLKKQLNPQCLSQQISPPLLKPIHLKQIG